MNLNSSMIEKSQVERPSLDFDLDLLSGCQLVLCDGPALISIMPVKSKLNLEIKQIQITNENSKILQNYLVTFVISFLLTCVLLLFVSRLNHCSLHRICISEGIWIITTAAILNIQYSKLKSLSSKVLVVGWTIFSTSMCISFILKTFSTKFMNNIFLIVSSDCQEYADIDINSEVINEEKNLPLYSIIILVTTIISSLLACFIEFSIKKIFQSRSRDDEGNESDGSDGSDGHDDVGSDKKLLAWQDKIVECSSNHSV